MADKQEVRSRWQHLEAEPQQRRGKTLAAGDDAIAVVLEPCLVLEGCHSPRQGKPVERIGIEAVPDALQSLDERALADREPHAKAGERMRLRECLDHHQIWI